MVTFESRDGLRSPSPDARTERCLAADRTESPSLRHLERQSFAHARRALPVSASPYTPLLLGRRGGGEGSSDRVESRTGVNFPNEFCHLSKTSCPVLTGIGSRRKRLLGVKTVDVYAVGFYVDQHAAQKTLGPKFAADSAKSLEEDQKMCDEVIAANDIEKTVRIVVTSGMVNHDRFLGGLRDSLVPACKKEGDTASLPHFERLFEGANFRKGLEIAFTSTKDGGLAARIDNRDVGEVASPQFTRAFFGLYLGAEPVSPDGKADMTRGLASIVAGGSAD